MDAIEQLTQQVKKLQKKVKDGEAQAAELVELRQELAEMKERLNKKYDFGDWG